MDKIDTVEKFVAYLEKKFKGDGAFITFTNKDDSFKHYPDDQISFHGEDVDEVFTFQITKVNPDKEK